MRRGKNRQNEKEKKRSASQDRVDNGFTRRWMVEGREKHANKKGERDTFLIRKRWTLLDRQEGSLRYMRVTSSNGGLGGAGDGECIVGKYTK
jgi:hypothetical protein